MKSIYIKVKDRETYSKIITSAYISEWAFQFPNHCAISYDQAKKHYHGNSKLLMHLFYNELTGKHELQVTTATIEKSYPQIKSIKTYEWENLEYEDFSKIFNA